MYVNMLRIMLFCRKLSVNVIRMTKLLRMVLSFLPEMISARDQRKGDVICMSLRIYKELRLMLRVYKELRIYNELVPPAHTCTQVMRHYQKLESGVWQCQ